MAALAKGEFTAHDVVPARMRDLPERARRAGVRVRLNETAVLRREAFDLVLADAPCSGSGSWRRAPEAKWALTPERLAALCALQASILSKAALLVAERGVLAYATCSLLGVENEDQVAAFLAAHPGWVRQSSLRLTPLDGGDGFFLAILTRS
jgi:16S rRNA (cytosine967-C5)-methyltransferase